MIARPLRACVMSTAEPTVNAPGERGGVRALDIALWIAAVPVVIAGVRLLMFSKGDPVMLRVLFENFQILPLLTASTLLVLPWATLTTAVLLLMNRSARVVVSNWTRDVPAAATLGILAITVVVMTSPFPMAYWIAGAWFAVLAASIISRVPKGWAGRVTRIVNIATTTPLAPCFTPFWSFHWCSRFSRRGHRLASSRRRRHHERDAQRLRAGGCGWLDDTPHG